MKRGQGEAGAAKEPGSESFDIPAGRSALLSRIAYLRLLGLVYAQCTYLVFRLWQRYSECSFWCEE